MQRFFTLAAMGAGVATAIHLGALLFPALNLDLYSATYPAWRHIAFCVIDPTLGWLFVTRRPWTASVYSIVTMQIYYSHGGSLVRQVSSGAGPRWLDVVAVVGTTAVVIMMWVEQWQRRRATRVTGVPEKAA